MIDNVKLEKLLNAFDAHGKIIVGVDFDDTIFALDKRYTLLCAEVRALLKAVKPDAVICLYTVADNQSLQYKLELMKLWGIEPDFINESPVKLGNGVKPFFNILLDDKAGLVEAYNLLLKFKNEL